ncbi:MULTISPECIES: ISLre2 family transposase [Oceanobacillus]|uniref:ISLre2 family transposase n=1 Tax=Oceanobacillus aidingensis TaxID=645964 RepID=A0ABV9K022_9BACI|nr:ISLre2 family transposase [Oceanobacillus oncorhynchi]MDM8100606.1 ISLre2 family transposase [Oceanobacillus oncorhynchi]
MELIISKLYELIKDTTNVIEMEEEAHRLMYGCFTSLVGQVFQELDRVLVSQRLAEGWKRERTDSRSIQFMFGMVTFDRTLMKKPNGQAIYPFDEWIGLRKRQRYSPLVEVKVAEMASESTYREVAHTLEAWTPVQLSHQTVGQMVKVVGKAQAQADQDRVTEMEEATSLPEGKKVDYFYAEADGVFIRGCQKKQHMEVRHAILYEGWEKRGNRVSLKEPTVILTTQPTDVFWEGVQTMAASRYSLEQTQVVTNSDGGNGYTAERFQTAFSQSQHQVLNQLDAYHVAQSVNRTFPSEEKGNKKAVRKAIKTRDLEAFKLQVDTYESTLEDDKQIEKVQRFRQYILHNWQRIYDWREVISDCPADARKLGAMESHQRQVSFRMKKRGMHWSQAGGEAMVKIKQGIRNQTLRQAYLANQQRSTRKQRDVKKGIRVAALLRQPTKASIGAKQGRIPLYGAHSSAMGQLVKSF